MNASLPSKLGRFILIPLALGALVVGLLVGASSPTSGSPTTTTLSTFPTSTSTSSSSIVTVPGSSSTSTTIASDLVWPQRGSAAIIVPELGVETASPSQPVEPIASLTKMMTAWVVLHRLPLSGTETGPCEVMNTSDLELYNDDVDLDLSVVKIVANERLCERTLLRGMLVHSAGDYAQLLAGLTGMRTATFVAAMNQAARTLKLNSTHYVDVTGLSAGDRSTAENQATMAATLMNDEPVVQSIVDLSEVSLPVAGVVSSYTPYVGEANVVGVKSGFTTAAGGCDVMAMDDRIGNAVITTYAVVLGEHSDNPLGTAGLDALTLSHSIRTLMARVGTTSGPQLRWIGPSTDVVTTTTSTTSTTTTTTTTMPTTTSTSTPSTTTSSTTSTTTTTTIP